MHFTWFFAFFSISNAVFLTFYENISYDTKIIRIMYPEKPWIFMPDLVFISPDLPINAIFAKWRQEKRKLKITGIARQTVSILKSTCHALSADKTHMFDSITVWNKLSILKNTNGRSPSATKNLANLKIVKRTEI